MSLSECLNGKVSFTNLPHKAAGMGRWPSLMKSSGVASPGFEPVLLGIGAVSQQHPRFGRPERCGI